MESKRKRIVVTVILAALILISSITIAIFYCDEKTELEVNEKQELNFIPGTWTPELVKTYNDSDPIEFLEYRSLKGIVINDNCTAVKKVVIVAIPDRMESRGSFGTFIRVETWNDRNVLIGDSTKSIEKELPVAYIFTNINVSDTLYNRYTEYQYIVNAIDMTEIIGIDLTREQIEGIGDINEI